MTRRIFDIENKKDYADLWEIVSERVFKITKGEYSDINVYWVSEYFNFDSDLIKINWHNKTKIIRPLDWASKIGYVGWFWDDEEREKTLGILTEYNPEMDGCFIQNGEVSYSNFRPAKKSELKFWEKRNE